MTSRREHRQQTEAAIAAAIARSGLDRRRADLEMWDGGALPITRPHVDAALRAGMSRRQIVDLEDLTASQHASSRAVRGESSPVPPPG